ncbi:TNFAIP3-interacting protein 1 isoform X2 [Polyodon spathula]|uniref:TNFAIP3-interacting protein 1 isoform X2 n=1 Tax=Polyodon spathula TaxID=7913 RepID=UPI001B7DBC93|nr:TNFAIP3-interacting protein 1 isoform X2 [Polyodon spathula]
MEGKGPYRIYDPGGSNSQVNDGANDLTYQELLKENSVLRERMKGLKSLGDLLEESQTEASKLRQRVEALVRDNEVLRSSSFTSSSPCTQLPLQAGIQDEEQSHRLSEKPNTGGKEAPQHPPGTEPRPVSSGGSSEFEVVNLDERSGSDEGEKEGLKSLVPQEDADLATQLQRLENSLSVFAEESSKNQLFSHLGRMALVFNRLSVKVQKNEQKTAILQTLCEQLRVENEDLCKKMDADVQYRNQDLEQLRRENQELKKLVTSGGEKKEGPRCGTNLELLGKQELQGVRMEAVVAQQSDRAVQKAQPKSRDVEVHEKKIRALEQQRGELVEVNKQWDQHFRSMKQQYEQKITELRKRLADSQKAVAELEAEREQRQRDYDRKLLLAKSKIENEEADKERLKTEVTELKQKAKFMQDQLVPLSKQREYQEKEIHRLNRALEEALKLHSASAPQASLFGNHGDDGMNLRRQELLTQIAVLKEQVKIFEEDFQKERSDRERMNEEKEELRQKLERLQGQVTVLNNQLRQAQSKCQRERAERGKLERLHRHLKQGQHERRASDHTSGAVNLTAGPPYANPFVQPIQHPVHQGYEDWAIHYPPRTAPSEPAGDFQQFQPVEFAWPAPFPQPRSPRAPGDKAWPLPENTGPKSPGLGKSERQNNAPGKY